MTISSRRFGKRSASRPPQAPKSSIGRNCRRGRQADGDAAAGQLEDQPDLGDRLHPVAGERDDLPGEVAPVVRDGEGVEAAPHRGAQPRSSSQQVHEVLGQALLEDLGARRSRVSTSRRAGRACAAPGRRSCGRAGGAAARGPSAVTLTRALRPSSGSGARSTRPASLEHAQRPRRGRPLDPLDLGQLAGRQRPVPLDRGQRRRRGRRQLPGRPRASCRSRRAVRTIAIRNLAAESVSVVSAAIWSLLSLGN